MPGKDLEQAIIDLAHLLRYKVAHWRSVPVRYKGRTVYQTPVAADGAGFPDFVLCRNRVVYVEAKSGKGRLSPEQRAWKDLLESTGAEYYVIGDEDLQMLAEKDCGEGRAWCLTPPSMATPVLVALSASHRTLEQGPEWGSRRREQSSAPALTGALSREEWPTWSPA